MNNPPTIELTALQTTSLFTIHLWQEVNGHESLEWRGKITNLGNQEVRYFRDGETLYGVLVKMVGRDDRTSVESCYTSSIDCLQRSLIYQSPDRS